MNRARRLVEDVEWFAHRILQDALNEAESSYWHRRAADFRAVGTPACDEIALACGRRAELSLVGGHWPEINDVLAEIAEAS